MELALSAEDIRQEIIADLSRDSLSAPALASIMRELTHKASGLRPADLIAIAEAVAGERCASAAAALQAIESFAKGKISA